MMTKISPQEVSTIDSINSLMQDLKLAKEEYKNIQIEHYIKPEMPDNMKAAAMKRYESDIDVARATIDILLKQINNLPNSKINTQRNLSRRQTGIVVNPWTVFRAFRFVLMLEIISLVAYLTGFLYVNNSISISFHLLFSYYPLSVLLYPNLLKYCLPDVKVSKYFILYWMLLYVIRAISGILYYSKIGLSFKSIPSFLYNGNHLIIWVVYGVIYYDKNKIVTSQKWAIFVVLILSWILYFFYLAGFTPLSIYLPPTMCAVIVCSIVAMRDSNKQIHNDIFYLLVWLYFSVYGVVGLSLTLRLFSNMGNTSVMYLMQAASLQLLSLNIFLIGELASRLLLMH